MAAKDLGFLGGSSNSASYFDTFAKSFSNSASVAGQAMASPSHATPVTAPLAPLVNTSIHSNESIVPGVDNNSAGNGYDVDDPYGFNQAQWEYDMQRKLLEEQRLYNSAEAQKNRDWQERMSNSAYQRAVEDLEKAGLNKWLAVTGGNGASASTPSGASATSQAGDVSQPNPKIYTALLDYLKAIMTSTIKLVDFF